ETPDVVVVGVGNYEQVDLERGLSLLEQLAELGWDGWMAISSVLVSRVSTVDENGAVTQLAQDGVPILTLADIEETYPRSHGSSRLQGCQRSSGRSPHVPWVPAQQPPIGRAVASSSLESAAGYIRN